MGVYGYGTSGGEIPEGYIDVILPGGNPSKILHPAYPGNIQSLDYFVLFHILKAILP
jgi:hypothetical protein